MKSHTPAGAESVAAVWPLLYRRCSLRELLQAKRLQWDYPNTTALTTHAQNGNFKPEPWKAEDFHSYIHSAFGKILLCLFLLLFFISLFLSILLFLFLENPPSGSLSLYLPSPSLHIPLSYSFCPYSPDSPPHPSPPPRCTAVQRQISVLVPVRQRHGKLHAKTQSANVDKGGGVRTSVHTKHQTHLNHKMKWLTSAKLENVFLPWEVGMLQMLRWHAEWQASSMPEDSIYLRLCLCKSVTWFTSI